MQFFTHMPNVRSPRVIIYVGFAVSCLLLVINLVFKLNNSGPTKAERLAELNRFFSWLDVSWSPVRTKVNYSKSAKISLLPTFDLTRIDRSLRRSLSSNNLAQLENTYFTMITRNHTVCQHSVRIGDLGDGGWDVCLSKPFSIQVGAGCIAFSFGINHVYGYDNELATKYNCSVRMFDPSMTATADGPIGTGRKQWFYKRGLAGHRMTQGGFQLDTLCSIVDEFAGAGTSVDLLKIDIEKWEWESLETALSEGCLSRVKQLLFETHTALPSSRYSLYMAGSVTPNYARYLGVLSGLLHQGFRMWKWQVNPQSFFYKSAGIEKLTVPCCFELYMVNWKFVHSASKLALQV